MANSFVALDVGSTMLRAVEVDDPGKDKPTILRAHSMPLAEGSVKRGEVLEVNTVASAMKRLWASGGFRTKRVLAAMGGQSVIVRDLSVPRLSPYQIRESLPFQVQDLLPVPVSEAVLDFYSIREEEAEGGPMVAGLLVAAFKQAVSANVAAMNAAGLEPVAMDLLPFALSRLHHKVAPSDGYAIHLNVGANATTMVVAQAGVPHFVRIVPMGSDDATRSIMSRLGLPRERAEQLKISVGLKDAGGDELSRQGVEIVHEATSELLTAVRNTLAYFASTRQGLVFDHISATGGGVRLEGFASALADVTRVPVLPVDPLAAVTLSKAVLRADDEQSMQSYTTAIAIGSGVSR